MTEVAQQDYAPEPEPFQRLRKALAKMDDIQLHYEDPRWTPWAMDVIGAARDLLTSFDAQRLALGHYLAQTFGPGTTFAAGPGGVVTIKTPTKE